MRYHKATEISAMDGVRILDAVWSSQNPYPIMCLYEHWFDIRRMTDREVIDFRSDFMRRAAGEIRAGIARPH